jgi:hypothetical protein
MSNPCLTFAIALKLRKEQEVTVDVENHAPTIRSNYFNHCTKPRTDSDATNGPWIVQDFVNNLLRYPVNCLWIASGCRELLVSRARANTMLLK